MVQGINGANPVVSIPASRSVKALMMGSDVAGLIRAFQKTEK